MQIKMIEIRDEATLIPAMAIKGNQQHEPESAAWLLRNAGWYDNDFTYLANLNTNRIEYDPFKWDDSRTMFNAHRWIREHWDELENGSVVDVQFILGETTEPKKSDRFYEWSPSR